MMPNDPGFTRAPHDATLRAALAGLTATPKTLPPWLFYDETGCRLFYEITRLPEYYLTRTELALLTRIGPDLLPDGLAGATLVEFGGSDETKARFLLDQPGRFHTYIPIDVARPALLALRDRLARSHPALTVLPIVADFMRPLSLPPSPAPRIGFFPGSTIGNLDPDAAVGFLAAARRTLGPRPWFLLGADLRKSPEVLLPAYNDAAGVTAAFNLNLLTRLNREAGADFDPRDFRHQAIWNDAESRIEMHLIANRAHTVHLGGQAIEFRKDESIHTENSYKHAPAAIEAIATEAGFAVSRRWTDPDEHFAVVLLRGADT